MTKWRFTQNNLLELVLVYYSDQLCEFERIYDTDAYVKSVGVVRESCSAGTKDYCINGVNSPDNWLSADAALYQVTFLSWAK